MNLITQSASIMNRLQQFLTQVLNFAKVISSMGNQFLEQPQDLMVLDTRDIVHEDVINTVKNKSNFTLSLKTV